MFERIKQIMSDMDRAQRRLFEIQTGISVDRRR